MEDNMNRRRGMDSDVTEIDLFDLFCYYLDKIGFIIIGAVLCEIIAFGVSYYTLPDTYSSTSKMYVVSASDEANLDITDLNMGDALAADYEEIIVSRALLSQVVENLKLDLSYDQIKSMVSVSHPADTRIIGVTVTSTDQRLCGTIANEIMAVTMDYFPKTMDTVYPVITEKALPIGNKTGPNHIKNACLGGMAGFMVVIILLTILFLRNDTIKNEGDIEKMFGFKVLATFPDDKIFEQGI